MADNFPKNYKCPKCGSEKTVIGTAVAPYKMNGSVPLDAFASLDKKLTPLLEASSKILFIPAILSHYDVCFDCGTYYCTRVELKQIPLKQANQTLRHT